MLAFYPGDFTPVCSSELALFQEALPTIEDFGARLVAISVDSLASHGAFARSLGLNFPLLSDAHPKGVVASAFGVYDEELGLARRGLFVMDGCGIVFWSHLSPMEINPGVGGVLKALG